MYAYQLSRWKHLKWTNKRSCVKSSMRKPNLSLDKLNNTMIYLYIFQMNCLISITLVINTRYWMRSNRQRRTKPAKQLSDDCHGNVIDNLRLSNLFSCQSLILRSVMSEDLYNHITWNMTVLFILRSVL